MLSAWSRKPTAAYNRVICEESVNDIFTITEAGRSVFICARISVYHVKHLHLIEFQMLSGIVMKPYSHCYGNLGWGGGYMVPPQNPQNNILMLAFMLWKIFVFKFLFVSSWILKYIIIMTTFIYSAIQKKH